MSAGIVVAMKAVILHVQKYETVHMKSIPKAKPMFGKTNKLPLNFGCEVSEM